MRLLLVEDEHRLAVRLARGLREEGFAVDTAGTTAVARECVVETDYDLVLLDLKLPDGSGLDLLAEWRSEDVTAPVLVLTAKDLLADKVNGLDAGADDYLTKPFSFEELLARIRALLRRHTAPPQDVIEIGDLRIDRTGHRVAHGGTPVELTPAKTSRELDGPPPHEVGLCRRVQRPVEARCAQVPWSPNGARYSPSRSGSPGSS